MYLLLKYSQANGDKDISTEMENRFPEKHLSILLTSEFLDSVNY